MRKLILLALLLVGMSLIGYFAFLNDNSVPLQLTSSLSLSIPLWAIMYGCLLLGGIGTELRSFLFHPERPFQRFRRALRETRNKREQDSLDEFKQAYLRCDVRTIRRIFARIRNYRASLEARVYNLEMKRYMWPRTKVLEGFYQLRTEFPDSLEVLLPYLQLAIELEEWGLVEQISHEIDRLVKHHPIALHGLRLFYMNRGNWEECIKLEKKVLENYPKTLAAEQILQNHDEHLHLAFEQNPTLLKNWELNYLPEKPAKHLYVVPGALSKANHLKRTGQTHEAVKILKQCFEKNGAPGLLNELEQLSQESGNSQVIIDTLKELQKSKKKNLYVTLVLARIYYRNGNLEEANQLLQQLHPESENTPSMYHALRYQLAMKQNQIGDALQSANQLVTQPFA